MTTPTAPIADAEDWIALWHSELAALAADREVAELWQSWIGLWASVATAAVAALPHDLTIADLGCGTGELLTALAPHRGTHNYPW